MCSFLPYLHQPLRDQIFNEALEVTRRIKWSTDDLAVAISSLAPYLSDDLIKDALRIGRDFLDDERLFFNPRPTLFFALIDRLPSVLLSELLSMIWSIKDIDERMRLLNRLAPRLPEIVKVDQKKLFLLLVSMMHDASSFPRHKFLDWLQLFLPCVYSLIDEDDHEFFSKELFNSIVEIGNVWP